MLVPQYRERTPSSATNRKPNDVLVGNYIFGLVSINIITAGCFVNAVRGDESSNSERRGKRQGPGSAAHERQRELSQSGPGSQGGWCFLPFFFILSSALV